MTAIEFFDKTPIENLISCLAAVPDKILFIGDGKAMRKWDGTYRRFMEKRGLSTELVYKSVNRHDLNAIVDALSAIVEEEESCVFDLTGGEDLALVAVGIVYERYRGRKNIQLQRFNLRSGVVADCDSDGTVVQTRIPAVTVEENILLHGGVIRYETPEHVGTYPWSLTPEFMEDIDAMWALCREKPGLWNTQILALAAVDGVYPIDEAAGDDPLQVAAYYPALESHLTHRGDTYASPSDLLRRLEVYGLITGLQEKEDRVSFRYKNAQIKRCLTKSGTVLEMKVLVSALRAQDKDGSAYFGDAMNGVFIDWDGELHTDEEKDRDTENEIDAVLMRGLVPVFISCKNGYVGESELYKLQSVAQRFGGVYAKKVLLATYLGKRDENSKADLRQRAKDMKIQLVENLHLMTDAELIKTIRLLANR